MEKEIISPTGPRKAWEGVSGFTTFCEPVIVRGEMRLLLCNKMTQLTL